MGYSGGHRRIDDRSLAMHQAIGAKLRSRPELLTIARENLSRWRDHAGASLPYLDEWARILDKPLDEVLEMIGQENERMTALRQSSPFAGVLDPRERWAIYLKFESKGGDSGQSH